MNESKIKKIVALVIDEINRAAQEKPMIIVKLQNHKRICGLTMDEWQVVIDGGFLCWFVAANDDLWWAGLGFLNEVSSDNKFRDADGCKIEECHPYRAVGHEQPCFDNDECKAYLDGLSSDALLLLHNVHHDTWDRVTVKDSPNLLWRNIDKFIVLDAGK